MAYKITIKPSNLSFTAEEGENVISAALRSGILLPYGCRNGSCGACIAKVVEGKLDSSILADKNRLTPEELESNYTLLCQAEVCTDVTIESINAKIQGISPPRIMPSRIESVQLLCPEVIELMIRIPANEPFNFIAGQYVDFLLADGQKRSYSIANAPHTLKQQPILRFHIRKQQGGTFSNWAFSQMKPRDMLRINGAHGSFSYDQNNRKTAIFLASGTGLAPLLSIIEDLQHSNQRPSKIYLYWGCRDVADLYYHQQLLELAQQLDWLDYIPVLSEVSNQQQWSGRTGLVHQQVMQDFPDLSNFQVYACGAPIVVSSAQNDFHLQCKLPKEQFFSDAFTPAPVKSDS